MEPVDNGELSNAQVLSRTSTHQTADSGDRPPTLNSISLENFDIHLGTATNFTSPRSIQCCQKLGIRFEDLKPTSRKSHIDQCNHLPEHLREQVAAKRFHVAEERRLAWIAELRAMRAAMPQFDPRLSFASTTMSGFRSQQTHVDPEESAAARHEAALEKKKATAARDAERVAAAAERRKALAHYAGDIAHSTLSLVEDKVEMARAARAARLDDVAYRAGAEVDRMITARERAAVVNAASKRHMQQLVETKTHDAAAQKQALLAIRVQHVSKTREEWNKRAADAKERVNEMQASLREKVTRVIRARDEKGSSQAVLDDLNQQAQECKAYNAARRDEVRARARELERYRTEAMQYQLSVKQEQRSIRRSTRSPSPSMSRRSLSATSSMREGSARQRAETIEKARQHAWEAAANAKEVHRQETREHAKALAALKAEEIRLDRESRAIEAARRRRAMSSQRS